MVKNKTYCISSLVVLILHYENHIETGQDRWHEINVCIAFDVVPTPKYGICSSQNSTPRIECSCDSSLR